MLTKKTQSRASGTPAVSRTVSASTKTKVELCVLCCQRVVDGKEDVLFCTGKCSGPIHRYCAGISVAQFEELKAEGKAQSAVDHLSFLCLTCTQQEHKREVKSTIAALKLKLKELVAVLASTMTAATAHPRNRMLSHEHATGRGGYAGRGGRHHGRGRNGWLLCGKDRTERDRDDGGLVQFSSGGPERGIDGKKKASSVLSTATHYLTLSQL